MPLWIKIQKNLILAHKGFLVNKNQKSVIYLVKKQAISTRVVIVQVL